MTANKASTFGVYLSFSTLRTGVDALKTSGFRNSDISVLFPEEAVSKTMPGEETEPPPATLRGTPHKPQPKMQPLIGGTLGWLTYISPAGTGIVSGALISLGVPGYEAERYESRLRNGGLLLCVRSTSPEQAERAYDVLAHSGAEDVLFTEEVHPVAARATRHAHLAAVLHAPTTAMAHN